ncbi:MAG TPA: EAL domain-containing protein, partial [Spirochaetia bacterium]|nr:EAL domain-containing protein [Spirochaetia bacterium]
MDIELLMQQDAIRVNYQPIVSIRARRIVGYESLARAVDSDGAPIAANDLFSSAREQGQLLELDRYCRLLGLREFRKQQSADGCVLFLNVNASLINASTRNSGALKSAIEETGIDPPHVAIELVESRVDSPEVLLDFVDTYRKYGCLIVLDDFGTAHSNLERLMLVRPDVIKIDRSIINRVAEDPYGKMVVSSIVALSHTVGALCLAEGVETFEQMLVCAQLGVDLFQGYVMSR